MTNSNEQMIWSLAKLARNCRGVINSRLFWRKTAEVASRALDDPDGALAAVNADLATVPEMERERFHRAAWGLEVANRELDPPPPGEAKLEHVQRAYLYLIEVAATNGRIEPEDFDHADGIAAGEIEWA